MSRSTGLHRSTPIFNIDESHTRCLQCGSPSSLALIFGSDATNDQWPCSMKWPPCALSCLSLNPLPPLQVVAIVFHIISRSLSHLGSSTSAHQSTACSHSPTPPPSRIREKTLMDSRSRRARDPRPHHLHRHNLTSHQPPASHQPRRHHSLMIHQNGLRSQSTTPPKTRGVSKECNVYA